MKKFLPFIIGLSVIASGLTPLANVSAGITDDCAEPSDSGCIIRTSTIYYHTTVVLAGQFTNEVTGETDNMAKQSSEIDANYDETDVETIINEYTDEFNSWADSKKATKKVVSSGISDYWFEAHDEITQNSDNIITINTV